MEHKDSNFIKYKNYRTQKFKHNKKLDSLLSELKELLEPVQLTKQEEFTLPDWPVGHIIGSPRSGTTLFLQWLASINTFAYPSNMLARFYYAPYIGGLIQKLLFNKEYDYHDELSDIESHVNFNSNLGKTEGALATHEFQHFFRNYMPNFDPCFLSGSEREKIDYKGIVQGLASIEGAYNKPFVTKNYMLQFHLTEFLKFNPKAIFFYIKRTPFFNMQSIYLVRDKFYKSKKIWWSVKPPEYDQLIKMDIYHQIAGQVYYTNKAIENELANIPEKNKIEIPYEEFCDSPYTFYQKLREKYQQHNYQLATSYQGVSYFNSTNANRLSDEETNKLMKAYEYFFDQDK